MANLLQSLRSMMGAWFAPAHARAGLPPSIDDVRPDDVRRAGVQNAIPISQGTYGSELYGWLVGDARSSAGMAVNEQTILCVSAVYACVSLIGGAIASMPLHFYQRTASGREKVDTTSNVRAADLWWHFNEQPNPIMSAAVFWDYMAGAYLLHGDGFAWIRRANFASPQIEDVWPLHPLDVQVDCEDGQLYYTFQDPSTEDVRRITVNQADMLHVPGVGFDGRRGMSLIRHAAKQQAGLALAADEHMARLMGNGARPDFVIEVAGNPKDEQLKQLRDSWETVHGGPTRSGKPAILAGGMTIKPLTLKNSDIELLATRQFNVVDIARIFGVPPHMIGETDKTSSWGSGVESMSIGFVKYTLQRHLNKIEQEINRKAFPRSLKWFCKFSPEGLLRGDSKSRSAYYRAALGGGAGPGWMTPDEVRRLEDLPPKGGDADELAQWSAGSEPSTEGNNDDEPEPAAAAAE